MRRAVGIWEKLSDSFTSCGKMGEYGPVGGDVECLLARVAIGKAARVMPGQHLVV